MLGALCLGFLAKPMIVTFPFVLLLLDLWPLKRLGHGAVREGIVLALAGAIVTFFARQAGMPCGPSAPCRMECASRTQSWLTLSTSRECSGRPRPPPGGTPGNRFTVE